MHHSYDIISCNFFSTQKGASLSPELSWWRCVVGPEVMSVYRERKTCSFTAGTAEEFVFMLLLFYSFQSFWFIGKTWETWPICSVWLDICLQKSTRWVKMIDDPILFQEVSGWKFFVFQMGARSAKRSQNGLLLNVVQLTLHYSLT